ncbi:MarR family winged helix-turn-helix transcriptional regulator [Hoeflea alexandrii]|uniref:MarR family winged helix-turn-helix transcriptional regulator n=1 Tax=Hoeflea alexandrii TaxID=288436 RepID=UPI0022AF39F3|nr:MarR family winged helix-turn-helix transcriptional regulator [Hoeflea alexandrii]MCZ4291583.1 MarR family winged helix-turn-helix transcriptional regulator [Hoeflea alexandrii]
MFTTRVLAAGYDLTSVQFAAMGAVRAVPGIDQAGVAAAIAYDRTTIGGVIDRLEKKGYIVRAVSAHDRRAREISLTPMGDQVFSTLQPVVQRLQREILQCLDDEEHATFMALLQKAVGDAQD